MHVHIHHLRFPPCAFLLKAGPHAGSLTKLSVNGNVLKEIPESVGGLANLQELHMQANSLEHLPSHLCDLTVRPPSA